jgi:hypothetical protein
MPAAIDLMAPNKPPIPDEDAAASAALAAAVAGALRLRAR